MKAPRKLTVTVDGTKDTYQFEGFWTGKDISLVRNHIERKYRLYVREMRRDNLRKEEKPVAVVTKESVQTVWGHNLGGLND